MVRVQLSLLDRLWKHSIKDRRLLVLFVFCGMITKNFRFKNDIDILEGYKSEI